MTRSALTRFWTISSYNEDEEDQIDFYIKESKCEVGDTAYVYTHEDKTLTKMEIVHIIAWSDDDELYDKLIEDDYVLLKGETDYHADTSAEFITDNDSYLVWFKYV